MYGYTTTEELVDALDQEFEMYDSESQEKEENNDNEYKALDEIFPRLCD